MRLLVALTVFVAAAVTLFAGFLVVVALVGTSGDTDCDLVELPNPQQWQALDGGERADLAGDLGYCSRLDGLRTAEVVTHLGQPDAQGTQGDGSDLLVYTFYPPGAPSDGELRLTVRDDRVDDVTTVGVGDP